MTDFWVGFAAGTVISSVLTCAVIGLMLTAADAPTLLAAPELDDPQELARKILDEIAAAELEEDRQDYFREPEVKVVPINKGAYLLRSG